MPKLRKMLGEATSPYILELVEVVESQSKITLANWALDYSERKILPIYVKYFLNDDRPQRTIEAARQWLDGNIKFAEAKDIILNCCHQAAREASAHPAAQAAARAVGQAASTIHVASHCMGLALYGAAAIVYDKYGLQQSAEFYDSKAAEVCHDMKLDLLKLCKPDEPNKANIGWNCKIKQYLYH